MKPSLLKSPFFIMKQIQLNVFQECSHYISGDVLDIGCGATPFKELTNTKTYLGIDLERLPDVHVVGSILFLPFKGGFFDSLIITEVLEHIFDPLKAFEEAKRVLRPGGHAFISVPMTWGLHYEPNDFWRYTKYALLKLAECHDLEVINLKRIGGIFSLIGARLVDVMFEIVQRITGFLSFENRTRLGLILTLPFSLLFYIFSVHLDKIDSRDALGWAIVLRKKDFSKCQ